MNTLIPVHVEVRRQSPIARVGTSPPSDEEIVSSVRRVVESLPILEDGDIYVEGDNVQTVRICGISDRRNRISEDNTSAVSDKTNTRSSKSVSRKGARPSKIPFWRASLRYHVYLCKDEVQGRSEDQKLSSYLGLEHAGSEQLNGDRESNAGLSDDVESMFQCAKSDTDSVSEPLYTALQLPSCALENTWESLVLEHSIKSYLLDYVASACMFSSRGVDSKLIGWNRMVLLHGPPGSGKTTLCRALAHKLSIRLHSRSAMLVEVHTCSIFSKWFSESSKNVKALFAKIRDAARKHDNIVLLVDEVESISASRASSASGADPGDSVRVVNALLTEIDRIRELPNVLLVATSNLTNHIDPAFLDRADIKQFIGLPPSGARYDIIRSGVEELVKTGIVDANGANVMARESRGKEHENNEWAYDASKVAHDGQTILELQSMSLSDRAFSCAHPDFESQLRAAAQESEGISGRSLRKLCLLAHARLGSSMQEAIPLGSFLTSLRQATREMASEREIE